MSKRILVVIPCGQKKIWADDPQQGPTPAKDVYRGAPFKVNRRFAEKFADQWVILSAKYGFIPPEFLIPEDYNVTFKDPSTHPIGLEPLRQQARTTKSLHSCDLVIGLGGKAYTDRVQTVFTNLTPVILPTAGLSLFDAMRTVNMLTQGSKPELFRRIGYHDD